MAQANLVSNLSPQNNGEITGSQGKTQNQQLVSHGPQSTHRMTEEKTENFSIPHENETETKSSDNVNNTDNVNINTHDNQSPQNNSRSQTQSHSQSQSESQTQSHHPSQIENQIPTQTRNGSQNESEIQVTPQNQYLQGIDSVSKFALSLGPFIDALNIGHRNSNNESKNDINNESNIPINNNNNNRLEEIIMSPIREMIFKSFRLPSQGVEGVEYVMNQLENMIYSGASMDLVVSTIGYFLATTLPPYWIDNMSHYMLERIRQIIRKFLNFKHFWECRFSSDDKRARLFVLQCALHRRFPLLATEGCATLSRVPVFYGTKQSSLFRSLNSLSNFNNSQHYQHQHQHQQHQHQHIRNINQHNHSHSMHGITIESNNERNRLAWELLQTGGSFKTIPCRHKGDINHPFPTLTMDVSTLQQQIQRDDVNGRLPCVVIASETDNLRKIKDICERYALWLHVEGGSSSLLLAAASSLPKATRIMIECADSISCQPFKWFETTSISNNHKQKQKPRIRNNRVSNDISIDEKTAQITQTTQSTQSANITESQSQSQSTSNSQTQSSTMQNGNENNNEEEEQEEENDNDEDDDDEEEEDMSNVNPSQNKINSDMIGNSTTLTFIRQDGRDTLPPSYGYTDSDFTRIFPLWHKLTTRSFDQMRTRVDHALALVAYLKQQLSEYKNIFATAIGPGSDSVPHILLFQVAPHTNHLDFSNLKLDTNSFHKLLINGCKNEIINCHIGWKIYQDQTCFEFDPLSLSVNQLIEIAQENISQFVQQIVVQINILKKCLELRPLFIEKMLSIYDDRPTLNYRELQPVDSSHVSNMVSLGAFRFVPQLFSSDISSDSVTILNKELKELLCKEWKSNKMFSLSMDIFDNVCIIINPNNNIFENNIINKIILSIIKLHESIEYPDEVKEEMIIATKRGIEIAQKRVSDSNANDLSLDKLARKIPVVGSLYTWFLPDDDINNHPGVAFTLNTKTITSTPNRNSINSNSSSSNNNNGHGTGSSIGSGQHITNQRQSSHEHQYDHNQHDQLDDQDEMESTE